MAQEPTGWTWRGTRLFGNQVIFFDRCDTESKEVYGHYQYDPFHQTLVRDDDTILPDTSGTDKYEVHRMIAAIDSCIEITNQVSSIEEVLTAGGEEDGYFPSNRLPFCSSNTDLSSEDTSDALWQGCSNTTRYLQVLEGAGKINKTIWQYVNYWRNFEAVTSSSEQTINNEWFIPSIEELEKLYEARSYLMGITDSISRITSGQWADGGEEFYIWSSTLSGDKTEARVLNWADGKTDHSEKLESRVPRLILCRYV